MGNFVENGEGRLAERFVDGAVTESPSKPLRPRRLGQLPTAWGAFCAGGAREESLPSQGR